MEVERFVVLELRAEQIELSKQQEQHWYEYSQSSLDAQAEDRKDWRQTWFKTAKLWSWLGLIVFVLVLGFLALLVLTGHESFALELLRIVVYGGLGGFGGYGVAKANQKQATGASTE